MQTSKLILLHYGELALKCKNRGWFEDKLSDNIRATLEGEGVRRIEKLRGRFVIEFADSPPLERIGDKLSKIFGVASFAPAFLAAPEPVDIEKTVLSSLQGRQFSSFAVRARRADKQLPFSSQEINEKIGASVASCYGATVNLSNPELTVGIEILSDRSHIYIDKCKGAGGLPVGTSGRVVALISGGIDSPVAAWRMMRRGCVVDFIHFHSAPFTDAASIEKVEEIVEHLSLWQCGRSSLVKVALGNIQRKIVTHTPEKYRVILYRRFMVRIACALARERRALSLVTGEALGQVASQTLSNLATVESASDMPILRPLIGMDKQEIVDAAVDIGTYDVSIIPHQDCCQFLEPRHPTTNTTLKEIEGVERNLDIENLVKEGLTGMEYKDIEVGG